MRESEEMEVEVLGDGMGLTQGVNYGISIVAYSASFGVGGLQQSGTAASHIPLAFILPMSCICWSGSNDKGRGEEGGGGGERKKGMEGEGERESE